MKLFGAIASSALLLASAVSADVITVYDEGGAKRDLDTASLSGCHLVFDSAGAPIQICKMERVEFRPPSSTRARPGHADKTVNVQVLYRPSK